MHIQQPTIEKIVNTILAEKHNNSVYFLMICEGANIPIESLIDTLNEQEITFFGGIFPGVIYGTEQFADSCIIKKIDCFKKMYVLPNLTAGGFKHIECLPFEDGSDTPVGTLLVVDAHSKNIQKALQQLNNKFGYDIPLVGAGAGYLSMKQQPCVFCNQGFFEDTMIFVQHESKVTIKVQHGWIPIKGPFVATKTDGKKIIEINWRPAINVYKEVINDISNQEINAENFAEIATFYPFGVVKDENKYIIRDPISLDPDGAINTVGELPNNAVIYIMSGDKKSLLQAAEDVSKSCATESGMPSQHTLVINCICRGQFLGIDFNQELSHIVSNNNTNPKAADDLPQGAITYGEISSQGSGTEFHNKTIIVSKMS